MNTRAIVSSILAGCLLVAASDHPTRSSSSSDLPADFTWKAMQHVEALVGLGPRPAGGPGESQAARYVADQFRQMGLRVSIEPFAFESFEVSRVRVKAGGESLTPLGIGLDPYGAGLSFEGPFVGLNPRDPSTWPDRGSIQGKAVVTAKTDDASLHFRLAALGPKFIVSLPPSAFLRVQGQAGRHLSLAVDGGLAEGSSSHVVAHMGAPVPAPQIILGAHMDSYRDSPGANDNATGVGALIELARFFEARGAPQGLGISFIAFGAEELGILGSRQYVEQHAQDLEHLKLVVVLDNLGGLGPVAVERNGGESIPPQKARRDVLPNPYRGRAWEGRTFPWVLLPSPQAGLLEAVGKSFHPAWLVDSIDAAVKGLGFEVQMTGTQGSDQMAFGMVGIATSSVGAPHGSAHTGGDQVAAVQWNTVRSCAEVTARIVLRVMERLAAPTPMACVRFLASDQLRGRRAGSPEADIAARYIAESFRAAGVATAPDAPEYLQEVSWEREKVEVRSQNVVGLIPGHDPRRAQEYVLLVAHYDGLGARPGPDHEVVFNGARDNALGTAALLTAAGDLAAQPPARSVLLLATTAEEERPFMIGSRFFVDHPLVPLQQIVFVLNNDGAGMYEPGLWTIGGLERTTAGPLVRSAGTHSGLVTEPYPEPIRRLYELGDSISFARKGIPALTVSPGFREADERVRKYVHSAADRVDEAFDEDYLKRFCEAFSRLARAIADAEVVPTWQPGDPFAASTPGPAANQ